MLYDACRGRALAGPLDSMRDPDFDEAAPEVFDFLEELERDRERGGVRELEHYLARFPGVEEAIRREYARALGEGPEVTDTPEGDEADGSRIGPYRLEAELGRGGQGVVYLALDTRIERRVALKLLPPAALLLSADRKARLRREAEVISKLEHPGICGVYDAEISGDVAYIAMRFVEGETLAAAIARSARHARGEEAGAVDGEALPLAPKSEAELFELLGFFEAAARALHTAHEAGVVHRDVKPANLMVTPSGQPVWLDFGQARDTEEGAAVLTVSGEVFGTPAYMSPEQITGHRSALDPRTDVWALGVSLFEALTLERPFEGESTHALLFAIQTAEPRSARGVNPTVTEELEVVLTTALEKDLSRRYASAGAFADELARIRSYEPIRARPASTALKFRRWCQRHPLVFVSVTGLVAMLAIGLLWTLYLLKLEDKALQHAVGRHLAERAANLVYEDPAAALALGIEAVERAPSYQTRSALYTALERCWLAGELDGDPARRFRDIELSPDGALLFAALSDGTARVYDLASRAVRARWSTHEGEATCVAASSSGELFASGGSDGLVVVYDLAIHAELWRAEGKGELVGLEFVEADGGELLVATRGAAREAFTARSGARCAPPELRRPEVEEVDGARASFRAPDGSQRLVVIERGGALHWELHKGGGRPRRLAEDQPVEVRDAAFSPDGARLAVAAVSGGVRLFDVESGRKLATFESLLAAVELLWTPDGEYVVAQTSGPYVQVWFGRTRPDVYRLYGGGGPVIDARFAAGGEHAVTLTAAGRARVWSTSASGEGIGQRLYEGVYPGAAARGVDLRPDASELAVCGAAGVWRLARDGASSLVSLEGPRRVDYLPALGLFVDGAEVALLPHSVASGPGLRFDPGGPVDCSEASDVAGRVLLATSSGELCCFDLVSGGELWRESLGSATRVVDLALDPTGSTAAVVRGDRVVEFRDLGDGHVPREPLGVFPPRDADWSADGSRLLVTGPRGRGAFKVVVLTSGVGMRVNHYHRGNLTLGSFSPDGELVMTASEDGTIFVRDVVSGNPIVKLEGDGAPIHSASFSTGEGSLRVIAALLDGSARVWPVDPLPGAVARKPRELYEWERAREVRLAAPLVYR